MVQLTEVLDKEEWEERPTPVNAVSWADVQDGPDKDTISGRHSTRAQASKSSITATDAARVLTVAEDFRTVR